MKTTNANLSVSTDTLQTEKKERVSYGIYFLGQLIFYGMISGYLQIFFTDISIPATVVAIIFLAARIWDAVNDPMMGVIVDKANLKGGKYKPWIKLSAFLIPVFTILLFAIPSSFSMTLKITLAAILYICWGMSYTMCDIPIFSVAAAMTGNVNERTRIISYGRSMMFVGSLLISIAVPLAYPKIGWFLTVLIFSLLAFTVMLPIGFVAKERNLSNSKAPTLKILLRTIVSNKYLMVFFIANIVAGLTNTALTISGYFAIYNLGSTDMMVPLSVIPLIPVIFLALLTSRITKKIDKFTLYLISLGGSILFSIVTYIVGYDNLIVFFSVFALRSIFFYITAIISAMIFLDCAEYGLFKTGENTTASIMSLSTFCAKCLSAVAGSLSMFVLGAAGFVSGGGVTQPSTVLSSLWIMISILPVAGQLVAFVILLLGYKLREKDVQIMAKVNHGELSRDEAKALFSRPY